MFQRIPFTTITSFCLLQYISWKINFKLYAIIRYQVVYNYICMCESIVRSISFLHKFQGNRVHELNLKDPKDLYLTYMMLILGIIINSNTHFDIRLHNQNLIWLFICTYKFYSTKQRKIMMQWSLFKVTTITKKYQTSKNYGYDIQFHNQI